MRPARSRRVQAQRKFAQGAYVPPNIVAVVAADNRRDAAQDPRNVTINNMTARGLLDVVALQSAASSPDRSVIIERLRGRNLTSNVVPPPSQRESHATRSRENPHERVDNNVATIKKPAEPPKLQTVKKKKEYKREHPMALRCRRPSKLQLNKLIAESCAPLRRNVASKRKKHSSDEDEPLIFQQTRLKQAAEQQSTSIQTAARESPKENIHKPSSSKEKSPKNIPCKKRSKKEITTSEVTAHETITKQITSKTTTKKITTNEYSLKETDQRNAKQSIAGKTPMKETQQKKIHKKCSPKQPAHVAPECSVPEFSTPEFSTPEVSTPEFTVTVIKEDLTDETVIQKDEEDPGTPDESVIEVVPDDPLSPDVLNNLDAPVVPPVASDDDWGDVLSDLDQVFEEEGIFGWQKKDEVNDEVQNNQVNDEVQNNQVNDEVQKSPTEIMTYVNIPTKCVPEGRPDDEPLILHNKPINDHDPEVPDDNPLSLYDVPSLDDDEPVVLHTVPIPKNRVPEDPVDKLSSHNAPMVNNDVPVILHDAQMINDDVAEDTDLEPMIYDECTEDTDYVPLMYDDVTRYTVHLPNDNVLEDMGHVSNNSVPEDTVDPDVPLVREDVMDSPLRIASPEPGPSGMAMQFKIYNSNSKGYDVVYCDHPMYLGRAADEPVRHDRAGNVQSVNPMHSVESDERVVIKIMKNSTVNLERIRNVQTQPPTQGVAAGRRSSDADEHDLMEVMENTAANDECTLNAQYQPPTEGVAEERRSSDADEHALMEIFENTAANLECTQKVQIQPTTQDVAADRRSSDADEHVLMEITENTAANLECTRNVQIQPTTQGVAADRRSSDADEHVLMEIKENTAANLEGTRNVQLQTPTPCVGAERRSSDADEHVLMEIMENTAANLEGTRSVQSQTPTPCVGAEFCSSHVDEPVHMEVLENTAANVERIQNVQLETPVPCAAAACRSDKDVINASKEFLDSRCKVCKPCIRIDKLMKVSALLESQMALLSKGRQNKAAVQENETTEREGETEDVEIEIDHEGASLADEDPGTIYLLVPNQSSIMMKLRGNKLHGKDVLGVGFVPKNESLINKEFSLEEHESLLDQIIENLTIYSDVNFEGRDINLVSRDDNLVGREVNSDVPDDNTEPLLDQITENLTIYSDVNFEGRDVNLEGREVNSEVPDDNTVLSRRTSEDRNDDVGGRNDHTECPNDDTEGLNDNLERQNYILDSRTISISSDSAAEMSDATIDDQKPPTRLTAEKRRLKRMAVKKKLAVMHERMREEKEREIARVEEEKRQEILRITEEKNSVVAQMSRYHERFTQMEKQKQIDYALLKVKIREEVISNIEAKRKMYNEVDGMAANLDKEMDAKKMDLEELSDPDAPGTSSSVLPSDGGLLVDAPVYHPTEEDFRDPLRFYEKIWSEGVRFGICKVVPPPGWKPPFRVNDEMRFDVVNQYISRLFNRWGPAARELCAIKLSLAQQKVHFTRPPLLDGVEVNLPKLYHLVQRHGGLEAVYNRKRWGKVAEDMKFNKGPNTERKLDQIYVKYLLPYDTLSHQERQDIMRKVEIAWNRKNQKLLDRALNPLNRQQRLLGLIESSDDETEDEDTLTALNEAEDCIIKGSVMNRAKFKKIATMTYENIFGQGSEAADPPDLSKIEDYYWRLVTLGTEHVCVYAAAIDTGEEGYGFVKDKSDCYGCHPWNPKMVSQNQRNVLQYLGQMLGVTMPTLLLGMLFSTSCWHKDPHAVAWLEFQLSGPERIWYGIPADQADNFRKAVETLCPTSCQNKFHWLPTDITMIPPNLLREHNVTLSRVTQRDGEYILAFPNAYTCCISTGYTESESVYFAPPSWLESLWTVFKDARESCEPTMFAMEHLLYNIGRDPKADPTILKIAQPLFDKMLREEVTNRQMLQERGLPFVQELLSASASASASTSAGSSRKKSTANPCNPRDQDECEYCRATLYLSKVKGLTGRNTVLCLEHALKLLDTDKYKDTDVNQLQVLVHVSVKELNSVHDDMKRRLDLPNA